jgi:hypothetical protein
LIFYICLALVGATIAGLAENAFNDWRIVEDRATLAFSTFWAVVNCVIVGLAAMIAREAPRHRADERFAVALPARCVVGAEPSPCRVTNISLGGLFARFGNYPVPAPGTTVQLSVPGIGSVMGIVARASGDGAGIRFTALTGAAGEAIRALGRAVSDTHRPPRRKALRVELDSRARLLSDNEWLDCTIGDASLSGAMVVFKDPPATAVGDYLAVEIPGVGLLGARVARRTPNGLGLAFEDVGEDLKDGLIRLLYTVPREVTMAGVPQATTLVPILLKRFFGPDHIARGQNSAI